MDSTSLLHWYCRHGNGNKEIREVLARGVDVNSKDFDGKTGLMWALQYRNNSVVKFLLEQPTLDLNCVFEGTPGKFKGWTALHYAAFGDNSVGVRLLLADQRLTTANQMDKKGRTPVMVAVQFDMKRSLQELVNHFSVDLDPRNRRKTLRRREIEGRRTEPDPMQTGELQESG